MDPRVFAPCPSLCIHFHGGSSLAGTTVQVFRPRPSAFVTYEKGAPSDSPAGADTADGKEFSGRRVMRKVRGAAGAKTKSPGSFRLSSVINVTDLGVTNSKGFKKTPRYTWECQNRKAYRLRKV